MLKSQFSKVIKKLPNIWIAIFLAYMSKTCIASSPKIMTNDTRPIKGVESNWTIECVGERPVTWNYTVLSDPITETTGLNLSSKYPYSAVLSIIDITYRDVQTYKCIFVDETDVEKGATPNCSFENVSCVHLFVDDERNLLASDRDTQSLRTMVSLVGDPLIIPCTPTSPFVKISLSRNDDVVPNAVYTDTEGYTINPGYSRDHGYYVCEGSRGNVSESQDIIVIMDEPIQENPEIHPSIATTGVKIGENFTLNCTLETASRSRFRLTWVSPNSTLNLSSSRIISGKFRISGSNRVRTTSWIALTVQNATKEDKMTYVCALTGPTRRNTKYVNYTVDVLEKESRSIILPPHGGEVWKVGHPSSGDCGGVLEGLGGEISYKYRQPYDENEGCIWTISVPNQSLIKVTVSETYFRRSTDYLSVGFFKDSAYDWEAALTWVKIGYVSAPTTVTVPGPVAFVQFISWTQPGLGFSLNFEGAGNKIVDPDFTYENYFLTGDYGVFKYDKNSNPTTNSKRTTIVIKPTFKNALDASKGAILNLQSINLEHFSNCTGDNLNIFAFEESGGNHRWFKNHTYCGKYSGPFVDFYSFLAPRHHPFIITMKTGPSCSPADPSILNNYALELFWRTF